jgi:ADP-ribosyl-[dinitrogen reductase] hydrolase
MKTPSSAQIDRACGALLGSAAGDALGAPYEFGPARGPELPVDMVGSGPFGWEPGEWTDDTSMAIAIAEVAATGADLRTDEAQSRIVTRWYDWAATAKDVGNQTRAVLSAAGRGARTHDGCIPAERARTAAREHHERSGRSAGNGSLMRTAPVALAFLHDEDGLAEAAQSISALTHFDPEAREACLLWCLAIRRAVLTGELDIRTGLSRLESGPERAWSQRIAAAEARRPSDFANNGWVVEALQGAWSAITTTPIPPDDTASGSYRADHLRNALDAAVRGGGDTDTVAAIAGGLLGAAYGASAVPACWRRTLHGWPGIRVRELNALASAILRHGAADTFDSTYSRWERLHPVVQHPYDDKLWIGGIDALRQLPPAVDAVVSLCRLGDDDLPHGIELVEVRLVDRTGPDENGHLDFVLDDTVTLIQQLRAEGHTVLLHCVQAYSRTPTVAALYGARQHGTSTESALADVLAVLPSAYPNPAFRLALRRADRYVASIESA